MDTSTFTHFCRAGHQDILRRLAPQGLILIPDTVYSEVENGRDRGYDIPSIIELSWVELGVLTTDEIDTQLGIKVDMPSKKAPCGSGSAGGSRSRRSPRRSRVSGQVTVPDALPASQPQLCMRGL